ncbi:UMP kinase [Erysipelotrichaceae bacterium OttesenSCG-928-M19]|nr:UMP kinase [Erysipelotrichaceae bacterium OttesenSCG-928-M19]
MYERVLLKLSGEALGGNETGISSEQVMKIAKEIKAATETGIEIAIVVGGGNLWRGKTGEQIGMERSSGDYMGMLATIMNALAIQNSLDLLGVDSRVQTSLQINQVAEPYIRRKAIRHLEKGRVVIFGGGTGLPYFSTDTTAALRAAEINADAILMAKNGTDGVYDSDPNKNGDAKKYEHLTFREMFDQNLAVIDATASAMCMDNGIDLIVFDMNVKGNIKKAVLGEVSGTIITKER